jgi:hypothetical protein
LRNGTRAGDAPLRHYTEQSDSQRWSALMFPFESRRRPTDVIDIYM